MYLLKYIRLIHGQGPSPILGVQAKQVTCIASLVILVNVWLI